MICIIGAGRSGTTILSNLLGLHPVFYKFDEKRYIWMYGAYMCNHDIRKAEDVTPKIARHIKHYFQSNVPANKEAFIEKTPSNCFRVGFIKNIFPEAKFIHIVRDGRAVAYSSVQAYSGDRFVNPDQALAGTRNVRQRLQYLLLRFPELVRRFRYLDIPPSGLMPYVLHKGVEVGQVMFSSKPPVWGARYPGIYQDRLVYSLIELAGIQWRESVHTACYGLNRYVPDEQKIKIRYEDLLTNPKKILRSLFAFIGVSIQKELLLKIADKVRRPHQIEWIHDLDPIDLERLNTHIGATQAMLGYDDSRLCA